ncbi:MAG: asparaginase domain-containing protein, partial [Methylococcaceae bacterium]
MKNILVVFTGGTIGSIATEGTINTASSASYQLLELFQQYCQNSQQVNFSTVQPLQMLSENLAPCVWQTLINAIEAMQPERYDGIIITHGTDTLAYTAAALSFYFNAIKIPVLLVASDYPLSDPRANGLDNFMCAVEFILQNIQVGVFVPYRNQQQTLQVHKGTRLTCSLQLSGDFFSIQDKSAMSYENQIFDMLGHQKHCVLGDNRAILETSKTTVQHGLKADFSGRILMIKPYPGLNYANFNLEDIDAVLHDLYHSGTACA